MLQVCILTTSPLTYALYVTFKLILRHVLPAILILLCILRPRSASLHLSRYPLLTASVYRTVVAKRISLILMGPPAVCECGPSGAILPTPHECPKMARWETTRKLHHVFQLSSIYFLNQIITASFINDEERN